MEIKKKKIKKTWRLTGIIISVSFVIILILSIIMPNLFQYYGSEIYTFFSSTKERTVSFASAGPQGHYYRFSNLIKNEVENNSRYHINVLKTEGTLENIQLINNKKANFALVQGALGGYGNIELKNISGVASIGWQYVHVIVRKNSGLSNFRSLKGKTISLGPRKSGNAALGIQTLRYFWKKSDINVVYSKAAEMDVDFNKGKFDAFFAVYDLHAPIIEEIMNTGKYEIVPINESESIAGSIIGCFMTKFPDNIYGKPRSIPQKSHEPFLTLKVKTYLVTHKNMNKYVIEKILRVIFSSKFINKNSVKGLSEKRGRNMKEYPMHIASKRFFSRKDPLTSDMYEIGSAYIAAFLFIAGVLNFASSQKKKNELKRKKENIIPYFEDLVDFSKRLSQTEKISKLQEILNEMMEIQRKAEKEWLDGKLDTEHMENLYSVYGIRCENIYNKMMQQQLKQIRKIINKE